MSLGPKDDGEKVFERFDKRLPVIENFYSTISRFHWKTSIQPLSFCFFERSSIRGQDVGGWRWYNRTSLSEAYTFFRMQRFGYVRIDLEGPEGNPSSPLCQLRIMHWIPDSESTIANLTAFNDVIAHRSIARSLDCSLHFATAKANNGP